MTIRSAADLTGLVTRALRNAGASPAMAASTAAALVAAEAEGMPSHGLTRVTQYAGHLRHGRVDGQA
ncbi:MAG: Ldh family oxidoreductase, partial [Pseudomonadota bacterium]|nr:Ldh family oxidoreductase [Pseudomonadota bacterium]